MYILQGIFLQYLRLYVVYRYGQCKFVPIVNKLKKKMADRKERQLKVKFGVFKYIYHREKYQKDRGKLYFSLHLEKIIRYRKKMNFTSNFTCLVLFSPTKILQTAFNAQCLNNCGVRFSGICSYCEGAVLCGPILSYGMAAATFSRI